jgi:hypothetical protein
LGDEAGELLDDDELLTDEDRQRPAAGEPYSCGGGAVHDVLLLFKRLHAVPQEDRQPASSR